MNIKYSDDNKVLIRATGVEGFFEIPDTVERVESCAFYGCSSLNAIVIPASVDFIGSKVFEGCKDLIDVFCNIENLDTLQYSLDSFNDCGIECCHLHVPTGMKDAYEEHPLFSQLMDVDEKNPEDVLNEESNTIYEFLQEADEAFDNGDFDEAMKRYVAAGAFYPSIRFYCNYRIGWIFELKGKYDAALKKYDEGVAENEEYAYLHLMKGQILKRHFGKEEDAEECFRRCLELEEGKIEEGVCWHHACAELGMRDEAVEAMNKLLAESPDAPGLYFDAACMYCTLQEYDLALDYLGTCLSKGYSIKHVQFDKDIEKLRTFERYDKIIEYSQSLPFDDAPYNNMSIEDQVNESSIDDEQDAMTEGLVCPECGEPIDKIDCYCYHHWEGGEYSDFRHEAPQTMVPSIMQHCPHCGKYFVLENESMTIRDSSKVNYIDPVDYPALKEGFKYYGKLRGKRTLEYNQRMRFLWAYNDYFYRSGDENRAPTEEDKQNAFSNALGLQTYFHPLFHADILRQAGKLDWAITQAKRVMAKLPDDKNKSIGEYVVKLAEQGICAPFDFKEYIKEKNE